MPPRPGESAVDLRLTEATMVNKEQPAKEQLALIERFLVAFNEIEHHLRAFLSEPAETSFTRLIDLYGKGHSTWMDRHGYQLRIYADLRNSLVHLRRKPEQYLSVPLPHVVEHIEQICDLLTSPIMVIPEFQRSVYKLRLQDPLSIALKAVSENDYSQFPVCDDEGEFSGLLTENGITRWLADHVVNQLTLVDFQETSIAEVLRREESRSNYRFVARNTAVLDVVSMFSSEPLLEAVLITEAGKSDQGLLGIVTRSDVQRFLM